MKGLEKFYQTIGAMNEWTGRVVLWFVYPMAVLVFIEVLMRYVFDHPTIWSWDVNRQILAAMGALGGGYALLYGSHVCVDLFSKPLSKRKLATLNMVTDILTVFALGILSWWLIQNAISSVHMLETDITTFRPPIYPLRVVAAIGSILLMLQAFCNMLKNFMISANIGQVQVKAPTGGTA